MKATIDAVEVHIRYRGKAYTAARNSKGLWQWYFGMGHDYSRGKTILVPRAVQRAFNEIIPDVVPVNDSKNG